MAWVKIPQENHPLFHDCLPRDPRISTVNMFGGVAAKVNGQMFAGLFGRGAIAKLSPADQRAALAIDGATPFDPMGTGRVMHDTIFLPESVLAEPDELRAWLRKAFEHTSALPPRKPAVRKPPVGETAVAAQGGSRPVSRKTPPAAADQPEPAARKKSARTSGAPRRPPPRAHATKRR